MNYSFCESAAAQALSKWHIRPLMGDRKLGGGADTLALCGRKVAWDLEVPLTEHHIQHSTCQECRLQYQRIKHEQD